MVLNNIEDLLKKYDNGETSLEEETQLKTFFSEASVPKHLEGYQAVFGYFNESKQEVSSQNLDLKKYTPLLNYKWFSVAALLILFVAFYLNKAEQEIVTNEDQLAYNKAKEYLELVSKTFNKGTAKVNYLELIDKAGTQVEYLKEMENPMGRIIKE